MGSVRKRKTARASGRSLIAPIGLSVPQLLLNRFGIFLGYVLAGYIVFDRGIAYVHIPGTPVYLAEVLLLLGIVGVLAAPRMATSVVVRESVLTILFGVMFWGLLRTVPFLGEYGIDSLRDAALWYYASIAVLVVAVCEIQPELPDRLARNFARLVPWLLVWTPCALILSGVGGLVVPGTQVSFFSHKEANLAVVLGVALAYLWLVPDKSISARRRNALSLLTLADLALLTTQTRSGFLAALASIIVGLLLIPHSSPLVARLLGAVAVIVAVFAVLNPTIPLSKRDVSVTQLLRNVVSIANSSSSPDDRLSGTVQHRMELWKRVLKVQIEGGQLASGMGFGPNLAIGELVSRRPVELGVPTFRNPHNSHLDVLARMGMLGLLLWVLLWCCWFYRVVRASTRLQQRGFERSARMSKTCVAAVVGILVNSFFDPTLEGPQVALLLWTLFGLGLVLTSESRTLREARAIAENGDVKRDALSCRSPHWRRDTRKGTDEASPGQGPMRNRGCPAHRFRIAATGANRSNGYSK